MEEIKEIYIETETEIFGLVKEKKYIDDHLNGEDWISCDKDYLHSTIAHEFSDDDKKALKSIMDELKETKLSVIVEIGIARSELWSSTFFLLNEKENDTRYVGIDINPGCADHIRSWNFANSSTIVTDSSNTEHIINELSNMGISEIDLFIIDGYHSINQVNNDFKLASLVRKGGYVFFHDTNYHPGPKVLLECVDEKIFELKKYYEDQEDWGVSTLKKLV